MSDEQWAYGPVTVTRRSGDYHACLTGHPEIWAAGRSVYEAVGDLVTHHPERFADAARLAETERALEEMDDALDQIARSCDQWAESQVATIGEANIHRQHARMAREARHRRKTLAAGPSAGEDRPVRVVEHTCGDPTCLDREHLAIRTQPSAD